MRAGETRSCAVLIGGTGFIGSHFIRQYINTYEKIVVIDARPSTKMIIDIVKNYKDKLEIIRGDITNPLDIIDAITACTTNIEALYMLAAVLPSDAERSPSYAFKVNIYGLQNILDAARILKIPQIIFPSSMTIYSQGIKVAAEDSPVNPNTIYGVTKLIGEIWGTKYAKKYNIKFKVLRFPAVIGPGRADGGLMAYASLAIQKPAQGESFSLPVSPSTKAALIYVKDAVRALRQVAQHETKSEIYNVSGVVPTPTAEEIVKAVKQFIPEASLSFSPNELNDKIISAWPEMLDDTKAQKEWNWKPLYKDLLELVKDFIHEVKHNPDIYRI